jgi:hypothetical protein
MRTLQFLKDLGAYRRKQTDQLIEHIVAEREKNANEFHREASDVEDCDPLGVWPHVHEPHDSKVRPYLIASVCAMGVGLVVAKEITEQSVIGAVAQQITGGPVEIGWKVTAFAVGSFFGIGEMAKAYFSAVERKRFFKRANEWYGATLVSVACTGGVLLIARVANDAIAPALATLEPWAWLGLEQALLISSALAWVASRRFNWSRLRVERDEYFDEEIKAAQRRLLATPHAESPKGTTDEEAA